MFENANGPNVVNFLDDCIRVHVLPRNICLDQARCLIGNKVNSICKMNMIILITAPPNDHKAIGLEERVLQTTKRRLSCIKIACTSEAFSNKGTVK